MQIATHPHIDLDAASCLSLYLVQGRITKNDIFYVSGSAKQRPPRLTNALFVDHPLGTKGRNSALAELPDAVHVLGADFVQEVDEHDGTGSARPRFELARIFSAIRTALRKRGYESRALDDKILEHWTLILEGLALQEENRRQAEKYVGEGHVPIHQTGPYRWAVPNGSMAPGAGHVLSTQGVTGYIYAVEYGLGAYRYQSSDKPDLNILREHLPGWFIHPKGFMACWGSRKAPRKEPPPPNTPQTPEELIQLLKKVL